MKTFSGSFICSKILRNKFYFFYSLSRWHYSHNLFAIRSLLMTKPPHIIINIFYGLCDHPLDPAITLQHLHFPGIINSPIRRFCACAINVKSSMCSETTKHLWYKIPRAVRYITSQQSYLSQINTRKTSFEACFDSKRKSHNCSAP